MVEHLIFFPEKNYLVRPDAFGLRAEEVRLPIGTLATLFGWFFEAKPATATLLFLHGNAGNVSDRLPKAKGWLARGFSVFLVDYRGYGESVGTISHENDLYEDAERALAWLVTDKHLPPETVVAYGESVGSAPAIKLASEGKVRALVLEAPFTAMQDIAEEHYGWVPAFMLAKYRFDNRSRAASVSLPAFVMQGSADEICPPRLGREIYELLKGPKDAFWIEGGHHNDLPDIAGADFFDRPAAFLKTHLASP